MKINLLSALLGVALMALTLDTAPASEPLSLPEAKTHLRVDHSDEDSYINALILTARQEAERISWRQFINATYVLTLDRFPGGQQPIYVPRPPLSAVASILYDDENGTEQTLSGSNYRVDTASEPGRITPAFETVWPATRHQTGAVRVTYVAGFGSASSNVPSNAIHWIRLHVAHWYRNREAAVEGSMSVLPFTEGLLDAVRDERLAAFAES